VAAAPAIDALLVVAGPDMIGHAWDAGAPGRLSSPAQLEQSVRFIGLSTTSRR